MRSMRSKRSSSQQQQQQPPMSNKELNMSGTRSLTGGSAISLDGKSLLLPEEGGYYASGDNDFDDLSSINSSVYAPKQEIKILGRFETQSDLGASDSDVDDEQAALDAMMGSSATKDHGLAMEKYPEQHTSPLGDDQEEPSTVQGPSNKSYKRCRCLPAWIHRAPTWLKIVFGLSIALLVGAVVLVGVGLGLALQDGDDANQGSVEATPEGFVPSPTATRAPTQAPVTTVFSTRAPVSLDADNEEAQDVEDDPMDQVPATPTAPPSALGPTSAPTVTDLDIVTFYVTGGRYPQEVLEEVPQGLANLPTRQGTSFLVNLGDWNSPTATGCDEASYLDALALFSLSSIPVYFVTGDNEFNDCPNPDQAMDYWRDYLVDFETKFWDPPQLWEVDRQTDEYPENFSFFYEDILFVGISLPAGTMNDRREFEVRHEANLEWIDERYKDYKRDVRALVVFAHASPEDDDNTNRDFFEEFFKAVEKDYRDVNTVLVHRNMVSQSWGIEKEYDGIDNLSVVTVDGAVWPPMQIQINLDLDRDEEVTVEQEQWYNNLVSN